MRNNKILLGMKKRGFGAGRWNGFGGKVLLDESIEQSARRETKEECGITITAMEKIGLLEFRFQVTPGELLETHLFRIDDYKWEPQETEEMRPQWFETNALPFDDMWPDDRYWYPYLLAGQKFRGQFLFGENDAIIEYVVNPVEKL